MKNKEILINFKKEINLSKKSASYLFYGDNRVDLLYYALEFSKIVMTKDIENKEEKRIINKQIDEFQHPDIEVINKENGNIKIDEVRSIIYSAIESSYNSPKKIFILSGVEQIRKESSNALLKILEEPPQNVYFILLSRTLNILSTIKSRTIKFYLEASTYEELGVTKEEYYFFDGNENNLRIWKNLGYNLLDYEDNIRKYEIALENIVKNGRSEDIESEEKNIINIVKYNKSIEYLCKQVRYMKQSEIFLIVNRLEEVFKQERTKILEILGKMILYSKNIIDVDKLKKLIIIKNSIKSNVNIRSILFNFFEILSNDD